MVFSWDLYLKTSFYPSLQERQEISGRRHGQLPSTASRSSGLTRRGCRLVTGASVWRTTATTISARPRTPSPPQPRSVWGRPRLRSQRSAGPSTASPACFLSSIAEWSTVSAPQWTLRTELPGVLSTWVLPPNSPATKMRENYSILQINEDGEATYGAWEDCDVGCPGMESSSEPPPATTRTSTPSTTSTPTTNSNAATQIKITNQFMIFIFTIMIKVM